MTEPTNSGVPEIQEKLAKWGVWGLVCAALLACIATAVAAHDHLSLLFIFVGMLLIFAGILAATAQFAASYKLIRTEKKPDPSATEHGRRAVGDMLSSISTIVQSLGSLPIWIAMVVLGLGLTAFGALLHGYTLFGDDVLLPEEIRRTETAIESNCQRAEHEQAVRWTATAEYVTFERSSTAVAQEVAWTATAESAVYERSSTVVAQVVAWTATAEWAPIALTATNQTKATVTPARAARAASAKNQGTPVSAVQRVANSVETAVVPASELCA